MALNNASYSFTCTVKQANGQPYDLTGKSLVMGFKNTTGATPAGSTTIQTTDNSIAVQSPSTSGIFVGTLSKAQMAAMAQGTWYWDLLDITNSTNPTALGAGILPVKQGISQSATPVLPSPGLLIPNGSLDAIQVTAPGDSIYLTLGPAGAPGPSTFPTYNSDPAPGVNPLPYFINVSGTWFFRIMSPDGTYAEFPLP